MTAEIAILNSSGIALAADSAVTIGQQKVYNSANKLFTLSKYHPVGVMVYDSADLMSIPWEIIIKEYRSKLGRKSFKTLSEYAEHFWNFLSEENHIIPSANMAQYVSFQAFSYLGVLYGRLEDEVKEKIENAGETNLEEAYENFVQVLNDVEDVIYQSDYIPGFDDSDANAICTDHRDEFEKLSKGQFGTLFELFSDDDIQKICVHISHMFVRQKYLLSTTGVVIAGFGEEDMFPRIASYLVEGIVGHRVKKVFNEGKSNIQNESFLTTIIPFAQDEMVWTFIRGIDPEITQFASTYLNDIFSGYPNSLSHEELGIDEATLEAIKEKLKEDGVSLLEKFNNDLYRFQSENNSQPIVDMVSVLPKDELAAMAESLVNLTVFKRKVSKSVETVGGPIDVAVISKGDGFIWVKRKHYFNPELNQHFFSNYFNGSREEDD